MDPVSGCIWGLLGVWCEDMLLKPFKGMRGEGKNVGEGLDC